MDTSIVRNSQKAQVRYTSIREEPEKISTDNSTNYYDTPKYVLDVLGDAVSKTYKRLPESRKYRQRSLRQFVRITFPGFIISAFPGSIITVPNSREGNRWYLSRQMHTPREFCSSTGRRTTPPSFSSILAELSCT